MTNAKQLSTILGSDIMHVKLQTNLTVLGLNDMQSTTGFMEEGGLPLN